VALTSHSYGIEWAARDCSVPCMHCSPWCHLRPRVPGGSMRRLVAVLIARAAIPPYVVTPACSWRVRLLSTDSSMVASYPANAGTP
jgi:hypothetical protein